MNDFQQQDNGGYSDAQKNADDKTVEKHEIFAHKNQLHFKIILGKTLGIELVLCQFHNYFCQFNFGKDEVTSSNLVSSSTKNLNLWIQVFCFVPIRLCVPGQESMYTPMDAMNKN